MSSFKVIQGFVREAGKQVLISHDDIQHWDVEKIVSLCPSDFQSRVREDLQSKEFVDQIKSEDKYGQGVRINWIWPHNPLTDARIGDPQVSAVGQPS